MSDAERVFVDSGAWIALYAEDDACHAQAVTAWKTLMEKETLLYTSSYVLAEVLTRLRLRGGPALAVQFGNAVWASRRVKRIYVDELLEKAARAWFERLESPTLSFTDASSFAIMETHGIRVAFTLDEGFVAAGFERVP